MFQTAITIVADWTLRPLFSNRPLRFFCASRRRSTEKYIYIFNVILTGNSLANLISMTHPNLKIRLEIRKPMDYDTVANILVFAMGMLQHATLNTGTSISYGSQKR